MPKFDSLQRQRSTPDTLTALRGEGFSRSTKQELVLLGATNTVNEGAFHEGAKARDDRFVKLVREATLADPVWTAEYIAWLRSEANMRSASIVAAATYVEAGGPNGRRVVDSALQRPDEPGEFLAFWDATYNSKRRGVGFPKPVKRGVADAAVRMYNEKAVLKYDGQSKNWRFGDVIQLTHPKPSAPWQNALFSYSIDSRKGRPTNPEQYVTGFGPGEIMLDSDINPEANYGQHALLLPKLAADRRLVKLPQDQRLAALPEAIEAGWSWERISGWIPGGMTAEVWEQAIDNMGLMALVRNLRNFDEAGISDAAVAKVQARLKDHDEVRRSRQFPIRFLTAWKNVTSLRWGDALETALQHSLSNVPSLPGRTLVLLDVSASMKGDALSKDPNPYGREPTDPTRPARWEVAGLFATAVAMRANDAEVVLFNSTPTHRYVPSKGESILRRVENLKQFVGGGTDTVGALAARFNNHDQVVIVTDEQTGPKYHTGSTYLSYRRRYSHLSAWDSVKHIKVPVITFNMVGYPVGHTPVEGNWLTIGGLNDASFKILGHGDPEAPWRS